MLEKLFLLIIRKIVFILILIAVFISFLNSLNLLLIAKIKAFAF